MFGHKPIIGKMWIRVADAINLGGLALAERLMGIEAPNALQQSLAAQQFVDAGDTAGKAVCHVKDDGIGVGDFAGWFEAYLSGRWYTFDARHNHPRIGRILMGTGRDAADVALTTSFGRMDLVKFVVISDEVVAA